MKEWAIPILEELKQTGRDYTELALIEAIEAAIIETDKRLLQAEGQLDGVAWNKEEW